MPTNRLVGEDGLGNQPVQGYFTHSHILRSTFGRTTPTRLVPESIRPDVGLENEILNDGEQMKISQIIHAHRGYVKPTLIPHPMVVSNELLGVEIELENTSGRMNSPYWVEKSDGSLRNNGREYVLRSPLGGVDLFKALSVAGKHFYDTKPDPSWRCSTHVHLDVRDMEVKDLKSLILLYTIFEEVMFKCSGYNRYINNFGPAFGFAQQQITELSRAWHKEDRDFIDHLLGTWSKYSSLNLLPISRFGSVEFRIANALTTTSDLLRLCNRVLLLKKLAVSWEGTHEELIHYYMSEDVFKIFSQKLTGLNKDSFSQEDVHRGCILANDILKLEKLRNEAANNLRGRQRQGDGNVTLVLSTLTESKIDAIIEACQRGDTPQHQDILEWARDLRNSGTYGVISSYSARLLIDTLGVPASWVVAREYIDSVTN